MYLFCLFFLPQYEPIIQPGSEPYVYRMVLTRCDIRDPVLVNNRFDCSEGGPSPVKACTNIIATWAMGAKVCVVKSFNCW